MLANHLSWFKSSTHLGHKGRWWSSRSRPHLNRAQGVEISSNSKPSVTGEVKVHEVFIPVDWTALPTLTSERPVIYCLARILLTWRAWLFSLHICRPSGHRPSLLQLPRSNLWCSGPEWPVSGTTAAGSRSRRWLRASVFALVSGLRTLLQSPRCGPKRRGKTRHYRQESPAPIPETPVPQPNTNTNTAQLKSVQRNRKFAFLVRAGPSSLLLASPRCQTSSERFRNEKGRIQDRVQSNLLGQ